MNNLYFRAWNPTTKEMSKVDSINFRGDNNKKPYVSLRSNNISIAYLDEVILMQGLKIGNQVVYIGDIVEIEYWNYMDCECGETIQVKDMGDLLHIEYEVKTCHNNDYYTVTFEILGNIYENKELVE